MLNFNALHPIIYDLPSNYGIYYWIPERYPAIKHMPKPKNMVNSTTEKKMVDNI